MLKVLGDGELTKSLKISAHRFSRSALEKIEKAGGQAIVLAGQSPRGEKQDENPRDYRVSPGALRREDSSHKDRAMWEKIRVIFTIPELRQKILLTLLLLAIYRVGCQITLALGRSHQNDRGLRAKDREGSADLISQVAIFSATRLNQATIFGLGIMPYISASIIFQLLASVYPPLEKLQKEGESGRKKINEYTRYATVVLCLGQSWFYVRLMVGNRWVYEEYLIRDTLPFMLAVHRSC